MPSSGKKSVLFVCLGNICRSPIAEAILAHSVKERGDGDQWHVDSAGTGDWHVGNPPDSRSLACLKSHNISTTHKARAVCEDDFRKFDFVFGLDHNNMSDLRDVQPSDGTAKLELLGDYDPQGVKEVPDPYYGGNEGFESVYQQCLRCCKTILEKHG